MAVRESVDLSNMTPEQMREALEQLREAEEFQFAIEKAMAESYVSDPEETQTRPDVDERALRGALYLDEHHPGWAKKINLSTFKLASASNCVLGQMYGNYFEGFENMFPGKGRTIGSVYGPVTGFEKNMGFAYSTNEEMDEVEKSWRILIAERQQHA